MHDPIIPPNVRSAPKMRIGVLKMCILAVARAFWLSKCAFWLSKGAFRLSKRAFRFSKCASRHSKCAFRLSKCAFYKG